MATRKDQLDAFVFARRRMVANLVAPTPTGSDEGAPRPVKTFFTSAILSAIAVAGVAVLGVFKPSAPSGWEGGLALDDSSGAAYVVGTTDKQLHPVLNITSAKLLLGTSFKKYNVPDNVINGQGETIGAPYGIPGAPPDVPAAGNVDLTQWTLCVQSKPGQKQSDSGRQTVLEIGYGQGGIDKDPASTAFVVHDSTHTNYLVTGDSAYKIDDNQAVSAFSSQVSENDPWVSDAWLKAFHRGTDIAFPTLDGLGDDLPSGLPQQPGTHIGDYGELTTTGGQQTGYIETEHGLIAVNTFVYKLYTSEPALAQSNAKQLTNLTSAAVNAAQADNELTNASKSLNGVGDDWPSIPPLIEDGDGAEAQYSVLCAGFNNTFDGANPHLELYSGPQLPKTLDNGAGIVQTGGDNLADLVFVKPGHAVLARDVSSGANLKSGAEYLVTNTGERYEMTAKATLTGADGKQTQTTAAKQLQYDNVPVTNVPDNWMRLVQQGAALDPTEAGTTPSLDQ